MTASADRPQLWHQLCFNADPNDTSAVPIWADYTELVRKIGINKRGAQYELAQSQAAMPVITWRDPDEILNPANTASPRYPDVQPYRQELSQAMWPNPEAPGGLGADVNLINSERWKPNNEAAADPGFESYANGAALPGWLTAIGSVVPTVSTTTPQQGTKCLAIPTAANTTRQGVSWRADCVPGEQYTSSVYVRQANASTLRLSVTGQTLGYDQFRTASASTWGTAPLGGTWTNSGGVNGDFTVAGEQGLISVTATDSNRFVTLDAGNIDTEVVGLLAGVATPAGDGSQQGFVARYTDANNYYMGIAAVTTSGVVTAVIRKRVAGVLTTLISTTTSLRASAGGIMGQFQAFGPNLKLKLWREDFPEPSAWTSETTDTALTTGTRAGCFARRDTANTTPTSYAFERIYITGYVSSSTTTTTGSYVRLSTTFTATQPKHQIEMTTIGTAIADTVRLDAIQHEIGASASAFTTAGPVIYPHMRLYVERWPRKYEAAGFVGETAAPAVDGFAALNAITLLSEYDAAVMTTQPAYYWTLAGGSSTAQALESSGNNGPSLIRFDSKYGPGTPPAFGTNIEIPGAPGTTGVQFAPSALPGAFGEGSILSAGRVPSAPGILFPRAYTSTWSASISVWVRINDPGSATMLIAFPAGSQSPATIAPIAFTAVTYGDGLPDISVRIQGVSGTIIATTALNTINAGDVYHLVGTVTQVSGGDTTVTLYINGTLADTTVATTASIGGLFTTRATYVNVGGHSDGGQNTDGVISRFALWERALSTSEITALWTAGGLGNVGETTGTRLARHLSDGRYAGETRISTTYTTLGAPSIANIDGLSDAQNLALAEAGRLWCAPDGALVLESRQDRWLRLTSIKTIGEDEAGGEVPYGPGITFDYDPTFVYADVRITRNNGSAAVGGLAADIAAVARKFFPRSYAIGADFQFDSQAQDYADYTFYTHRAPLMRVSAITIQPAANPALWPVALGLEVGQRVTVKRRAKAANGGAGLTMSADYFIESVIHSEIDFNKWDWRVSFLLSPIGTAPGPTFQPWILENATYGVLDSTTILGW